MKKNKDKAADHNRKVAERRNTVSTDRHDNRKSMVMQLEQRLESAQKKRSSLLKQISDKQAVMSTPVKDTSKAK